MLAGRVGTEVSAGAREAFRMRNVGLENEI
jgi:hypothetical protein